MDRELDIVELLARVPFFSSLDQRRRKRLARLCIARSYVTGATIIEEGSTGLGLMVITEGEVEIFKTDNGNKVILANLTGGDVMGEMALIDEQPRSASAVAVKESRCLLLTRESFRRLVKKDTEIAWSIVPILVERMRNLQNRLIKSPARQPETLIPVKQVETPGDTDEPETRARDPLPESAATNEITDLDPESESEESYSPAVIFALHLPFSVLFSGAVMLGEVAGACEASLHAFAQGSGLTSAEGLGEFMRGLPNGMRNASREALNRGMKIPERTCSRLQKQFSDPDEED